MPCGTFAVGDQPLQLQLLQRIAQALETLSGVSKDLTRIADVLDPPPADVVDSPYVARRLSCTTVWVAEMARTGVIPKGCILPGTGNGKPWKFYRVQVEKW